MFRLSHYMKQLFVPTPVRAREGPVKPVVIWNLTRRCNLKCRHCYAVAADHDFPGELSTDEAIEVLDDLAAYGIQALILSGGEPLSRPDTMNLARRAKGHTLYLLDEPTTGLHIADITRLLAVLQRLVDAGNTVVVIEHNVDVIKAADWIVDLGPEGGEAGGRIVVQGPPERVAQTKTSHTGTFLDL